MNIKLRLLLAVTLLDPENPYKVLAASQEPILVPQEPYETIEGFRTNVIFPEVAILESTGTIKPYYGASDTVICLAEVDIFRMTDCACIRKWATPLAGKIAATRMVGTIVYHFVV